MKISHTAHRCKALSLPCPRLLCKSLDVSLKNDYPHHYYQHSFFSKLPVAYYKLPTEETKVPEFGVSGRLDLHAHFSEASTPSSLHDEEEPSSTLEWVTLFLAV